MYLNDNQLKLLTLKYLLPGESLDAFFNRITNHLYPEGENPEKEVFRQAFSRLEFVPSSPTLYNAGLDVSQCSSCFIQHVDDNLSHIYESIKRQALLSKYAGGIAQNWTSVRGCGASLRKQYGKSRGIIPFIKCVETTSVAVDQSGKRKGACCVYLEPWHIDIEDFIDLREETGLDMQRTHQLHTAIFIPDLFLKRVETDGKWTLFDPYETQYQLNNSWGEDFEAHYIALEQNQDVKNKREVGACYLWRKIVSSLYSTGHPWLCFKDTMNRDNPQAHCGMIRSSNLCTEITLNTDPDEVAVCNLGSINLAKVRDHAHLKELVHVGIKALNRVIDYNYYSIVEAKNTNQKHRPVGLGVMGLADYLYQRDLHFEHPETPQVMKELFAIIQEEAIQASMALAERDGVYDSWKDSRWDQQGIKVRNSHLLAIAPTATISAIAGAYPSIEPPYSNIQTKSMDRLELDIINSYLIQDCEKRGCWNDATYQAIKENNGSVQGLDCIPLDLQQKYKTAFEIDPYVLLDLAAIRQQYIDQSQSLNVFISNANAKGGYLSQLYQYAWKRGIKTTYYLHSEPASRIYKA